LRSFAEQGDDEEVQAAFRTGADRARTHGERLLSRLEQLGGSDSAASSALPAAVSELVPKLSQAGRVQEEQMVQNLSRGSPSGRAHPRCTRRLQRSRWRPATRKPNAWRARSSPKSVKPPS
jgi:hypothetical protein